MISSDNQSRPKRPRLDALTGIRFFAALHVLIYHEFVDNFYGIADKLKPHGLVGRMLSTMVRGVVDNGSVSVGLFFILSGFILAYTYLDRAGELIGTPGRFFINRFARIYPTYLLGILLAAPFEISRIADWGRLTWTGVLNVSLLQAWWPPVATSWNAPGWSLSVEALFYVSFPFLAVAMMRRSDSRRAWLIAGLSVGVLLVLGIARAMLGDGELVTGWNDLIIGGYFVFFPLFRLPEFILGVAIGRWFFLRHSPDRDPAQNDHPLFHWLAPVTAIAVPIVLALPFSEFTTTMIRPTVLSLLFAGLICGLAVNAAGRPGVFTKFLSIAPLILLGEASYALYIIHVPIGRYIDRLPKHLWRSMAHTLHLPTAGTAQAMVYLVIVISAAILIFLGLENPSRRWLRKRLEAVFIKPEPELQTASKM